LISGGTPITLRRGRPRNAFLSPWSFWWRQAKCEAVACWVGKNFVSQKIGRRGKNFVSKESMFAAGKQIKNALKIIFFFFLFFFKKNFYKSFCSVIVYEKKRHELGKIKKKSHSMTVYFYKIKKRKISLKCKLYFYYEGVLGYLIII
jgi:hypothetical protein